MAKYSTGGGSGDTGGSCELCGATDSSLETVEVAGARLDVCEECAQHRDDANPTSTDNTGGDGRDSDRDRKRKAAQNTARVQDATKGDSTHWEESGTNYDDDQLPYLHPDYGKRLTEARQDAGLQREELAAEIDVEESDILAVEQSRATKAGVGGSTITKLEDFLDIELADA
ncbi:transcriptional regulator [Halapricum sp. CBA1109]|uniref:helix-turn-helix domain-containing protein n=1 Tax=Halapricum sp. CBA1109 TaxID=2668068 RepID=UPI0012FCE0C1|nr:multiprotein-bridging factor 1 family protein [Halapricum sp. CBA1109]MUV88981.1 transcriptional regulator [Halapricum sp. CBA1109]